MTRTFIPLLDILPLEQRRLWPSLQQAAGLGFVLYGGTAIALRLGHRTSIDFDFFTEKSLVMSNLGKVIDFMSRSTVLQDSPNTLTVIVEDQENAEKYVKVSFFGDIGHGRVGEPEQTKDGVLLAASLEDLMATKLKVIMQRVEAKDYLDIAAIIKAGIRLDYGLAAARMLYGKSFQPSECLKALVYFEGGDLARLPEDVKGMLVKEASDVRDLPRVGLAASGHLW